MGILYFIIMLVTFLKKWTYTNKNRLMFQAIKNFKGTSNRNKIFLIKLFDYSGYFNYYSQ